MDHRSRHDIKYRQLICQEVPHINDKNIFRSIVPRVNDCKPLLHGVQPVMVSDIP